jgi:SAM-dependent methyltransferase
MQDVTSLTIADRIGWLQDHCRDQKVLDVGCVDHDAERMAGDLWLHRRLSEVASELVGIDYEADGVRRLREEGYDVVHGDITAGSASVADRVPFDVVVAGEVIEHLPCPQSLFSFAHAVLRPGGLLALTTPNPYAPWRVRAGQMRHVWENVDHVVYAFPSGVAEMGNRTGLRLLESSVTDLPWSGSLRRSARAGLAASVARAKGRRADDNPGRLRLPLRSNYLTMVDVATLRYRRSLALAGETSLYLLRKD